MQESSDDTQRSPANAKATPTVSVILPTYNREEFLSEAFESIRGQSFADWELIIVDDGSTDRTSQRVAEAVKSFAQPVRYIRQQNRGAYAARNTGLYNAAGKYIAFFDSDDLWLPHHLSDCVAALEANRDVGWVYGACRIVEQSSQKVLTESTFYEAGRPREFLKLKTRAAGRLRIINDSRAVEWMFEGAGVTAGLQASVFRREVVRQARLPAVYIGEDRAFVVSALVSGVRFGYFDDVHVIYRVHRNNLSMASQESGLERQIWAQRELIRAYEGLEPIVAHDRAASKALQKLLSREYFWDLGYATLWQHGRRAEAMAAFRKGMSLNPLDARFWKSYGLARWRMLWSSKRAAATAFKSPGTNSVAINSSHE
jgi:glycosyltransferase involved in cell wall biosynthesis